MLDFSGGQAIFGFSPFLVQVYHEFSKIVHSNQKPLDGFVYAVNHACNENCCANPPNPTSDGTIVFPLMPISFNN
jgi:hypothetical protein